MEIRVLRNFLVVVREQNITRAAESLHIAQPSLSKQLMDLERELGKPLLIRGKRKITLTEDGVLLRKRAEEIVALMEKAQREIASDTAEISGRIAIGGLPPEEIRPRAAAALRTEHNGVQFDFYASDATDITERLDHGVLDFAVLLEPVDAAKDDFVFPCAISRAGGWWRRSDARWPRRPAVRREDLCSVPLMIHRRAGLQLEIARWAQTEPERLHVVATYNVVDGNPAAFVRSGLGHESQTSEDHLAANLDPDVCFRPLEPPLEICHALVWKRYPVFSKAAEAFLQRVRAMCSDDGERD